MPNMPTPQTHMDALGQAIAEGRDLATYLWQVPDDAATLKKVVGLLKQIEFDSRKQGRREMPRICDEMLTAMKASASPQQLDILQDGFDRLSSLWSAARSGLL